MKKRIMSLALSLNILLGLSSCIRKEKHKNYENSTPTSSIEEISNTSEVESSIDNLDEETIQKISCDVFINNINNIGVVYNNEDCYPTLDDVKIYNDRIQNNQKCMNQESDYRKLFEMIRENTIAKYGKENGVFRVPDKEYTSQEILDLHNKGLYVAMALSSILEKFLKNDSNNVLEDYCRLKEVSIIIDNSEQTESNDALGKWDNDSSTITIYYQRIIKSWEYLCIGDDEKLNNEYEFYLYLQKIVKHEVDHARQSICSCKRKKLQKQDENIVYINDVLNMEGTDPYLSFMTESSAEAIIYNGNYLMNESGHFDYAYCNEREREILLFLLSVFCDNREVTDYYNAILDGNLEAFFKFFDVNSDQEILNLYKILYSLDALSCRNALASKIANGRDSILHIELEEQVGYGYLEEIFKNSIIDLITSTNNNDLELDDCVMLYLYVKSYVTNYSFTGHTEKDEESNNIIIYDDSYMRILLAVEREFINFLCSKYRLTVDEAQEKLENRGFNSRLYEFEKFVLGEYYDYEYHNSFNQLINIYPMLYNIIWTKVPFYDYVEKFDDYAKKKCYKSN